MNFTLSRWYNDKKNGCLCLQSTIVNRQVRQKRLLLSTKYTAPLTRSLPRSAQS